MLRIQQRTSPYGLEVTKGVLTKVDNRHYILEIGCNSA